MKELKLEESKREKLASSPRVSIFDKVDYIDKDFDSKKSTSDAQSIPSKKTKDKTKKSKIKRSEKKKKEE